MTLREAAEKALAIYMTRAEAADYDSGFDAGEFSGPAHSSIADREVERLANANGFTLDEVLEEVALTAEADDGPYGRIA